jgi:hypothetical protein
MNVFSRPTPEARGLGMTSQRARDRLIDRLKAEGIADRRVLDVMRRLPRHLFIEEALASRAYEDTALPIGLGQTISQPWVVARMTEALIEHKLPAKVLEVGTGSGYQAAVLAAPRTGRLRISAGSVSCRCLAAWVDVLSGTQRMEMICRARCGEAGRYESRPCEGCVN